MLLPLILAALPLVLAHSHPSSSHSHASTRKTISFGPSHPHAKFHLHKEPAGFAPSAARDPMEAARDVLKGLGEEGKEWRIRDDSYTDKNTRITHVYARQIIAGLEVIDGDMNLNVDPQGTVLSSGTSFYEGIPPDLSNRPENVDIYESHCATLKNTLAETTAHFKEALASLSLEDAAEHLIQYGHDQVTFGAQRASSVDADAVKSALDSPELERLSTAVKQLTQSHAALCLKETASSLLSSFSSAPGTTGAGPALLSFLALVTPSPSLARKIHTAPEEFLAKITSTFTHEVSHAAPVEHLTGAPEIVSPAKATLGWIQDAKGGLRMVWNMEVEMSDNWYQGAVDVETGKVLGAVDWVRDAPAPKKPSPSQAKATYNVWPFGVNDPVSGKRDILIEPHDKVASPAGWHSIPGSTSPFTSSTPGVKVGGGWTNTTTTIGNNVFAQEDWEGQSNWINNYRPITNSSLTFDYEYGAEEGLRPKEYIDLAVTQLFYTCNEFHDLTYRLGFDELSGNFQQDNFGKGGKGNDAVIALAQDGSGTNNANFATPPDGVNGRMRMYVWDTATPYRDGDLEAGIVIHEYAHGLSTRLTGGPANSGCLGWGESGGMGEGWGDFLATQIRKPSAKYSDYPMGAWAANREGGIRNYPYSTNETVNPSTYKILDQGRYFGVHAIGEVWAEMLFVLTERLIARHGFSKTLFPPEDPSKSNDYYVDIAEYDSQTGQLAKPLIPKHGNTLAVQLVINGLKLQPCRPSFLAARDAIVQADKILTGGENACDIWSAFAERGLGPDAVLKGALPWGGGIREEDFKIPKGICKTK